MKLKLSLLFFIAASCQSDPVDIISEEINAQETKDDSNEVKGNADEQKNSSETNNEIISGQISLKLSQKAGNERSFYLSLPKNYTQNERHKLVLVFAGTDSKGFEMKEYIGDGWSSGLDGIEAQMPKTIFVYPDPKWRYFSGWNGTYGGWLLGPNEHPAKGMEDLYFVDELIDWLIEKYNIDQDRIFATGHSWGGDMTCVVGCFLGNRFRAIAPVAANKPYWFNSNSATSDCKGSPAVWTFYGLDDDYFADRQSEKGQFGKEQNDFGFQKTIVIPAMKL